LVLPEDKLGIIDFGRMDTLSETDRRRMAVLVKAVIDFEETKAAEILSEFSDDPLEPERLEPDVRRLLKRYQGLPLGEIKLGEMMQALMQVAYRHHLKLPHEWVLLMQSLSMVEAILSELDPDFDVIEAAEPHIARLQRRRLHPESWLPPAIETTEDWLTLGRHFPKSASRLLRQAERGQLRFEMHVPEVLDSLPKVDQAANRLSISLLLAALIVALGLIVPSLDLNARPWDAVTWLGVLSFGAVSLLGIALAVAIWKSD
jgi:ubiquinone biosynthesis protein